MYKESGRLVIIFLISSFGTMLGAIIGYVLLNQFIPDLNHIAGMMAASYIGGGVNFVSVSSSFNISSELISAATVSDNLLMVLYFFVLIILPSVKVFSSKFIRSYDDNIKVNVSMRKRTKTASVKDITFSIAISALIVTISFGIAKYVNINKYLVLTTITVILTSIMPMFFKKLEIAQEIGTFLIYIFFVVIGIPASIYSIINNTPLLLVFCLIMVLVNMIVTFIFAKLLNFSLEEAILVSNANIGGPTTAMAMAVSKGWEKYAAPVMLVGTLGYVIGSYFGILIGNFLM